MTGGVIKSVLSLLLVFGLAGQTPSSQEPAAQQSTPRFRSSVDIVSVAAVVRDKKGRFVRDLGREDFEVVDGGQRRPIVDFRAEIDGPVKLAVLLDISGSMRLGGKVVDARQAASHVFAALRPHDQAAVFAFDTQVDLVADFTSNRAELEAAFDKAGKPFGQTSLYDAIARTARAAVKAAPRTIAGLPQRTAVVVLTDGVDTRSKLTPAEVSAVASGIDVQVYIIAVVSPIDDPRVHDQPPFGNVTPALQNLSQWTGGELFLASAPAHASLAARQIVSELRHQYVLAFEAAPGRGWRPLQVRSRDGLQVRARSGYSGGTD